ncbi:Gmad2 immunoglobulin-like domain-containing protein [Arsenicicoccus dermatophilus]|uniref:Gmad2 immunoglobulin-like domain-containing protein n=1 Tax=Arsenicicoccus dermatophilus TaxID=1076331 RepID=UPI0039176631
MDITTTRRALAAAACALALGGVPALSAQAVPAPAQAAPARSAAVTAAAPALPVYFVDQDGTTSRDARGRAVPTLRLYREYVAASAGLRTVAARAEAAANAATIEAGRRGHVNAWGERVVTDVQVQRDRIVVALDGPTRAVDAETARVAVAPVVWTVTATVGKDLPATFRSRDGKVVGPVMAGGMHRRASGLAQLKELAAVWVDSPGAGQVVPASKPVTVSGSACSPEANVAWRLTRGTSERPGFTTASIACPTRGSWRVGLGNLARGTYRFEAWAPGSGEGQAPVGRVVRTFTVR